MKLPSWPGVGVVPLLLVLVSLPSTADAGPRIHVQNASVDYGTVPIEQLVEHRFRLKNVGDAPLRITNRFCHDNLIRTQALEGC